PREIVLGRLAGKLSQVGMILLAGVPALALLAAWNDLGMPRLLAMLLLLAGLGLGGGGMAIMASVVSRRGPDALLAVYLFTIVLLLAAWRRGWACPPSWTWRWGGSARIRAWPG